MKYFAQTLLDEMLKWYIFEILTEHTTAPWATGPALQEVAAI